MKYKNQLIDYIIENEARDFWNWVDSDSELSEAEIELISQQANCMLELDISIMTKLATKHIFAVAYMAEREGK